MEIFLKIASLSTTFQQQIQFHSPAKYGKLDYMMSWWQSVGSVANQLLCNAWCWTGVTAIPICWKIANIALTTMMELVVIFMEKGNMSIWAYFSTWVVLWFNYAHIQCFRGSLKTIQKLQLVLHVVAQVVLAIPRLAYETMLLWVIH